MLRVKTFSVCLIIYLFCALNISAQEEKRGANPAWQKGSSNAKFVIEVFNDYQCPPCATFNETIKEVLKKHPNDVLVIYRQFPLSIPAHTYARLAAQATEAAGMQNKFWEMSEMIFQKQQEWRTSDSAEKLFIRYARKLGLKAKRFKKDLYSSEVTNRINLDVERARSFKLDYTPSVLLNGEILSFPYTQTLEETIFSKKEVK